MLTIAGEELGGQAHGQRHREQERVEHGTVEVDVEGEDADHQQQGHFQEKVAEAPHPALEVGLGRAQLQTIRHGPELGVTADRDHHGRGGARNHVGAHKNGVRSFAQRRLGRQDRHQLFRWERLAGQGGFVRKEVSCLEE